MLVLFPLKLIALYFTAKGEHFVCSIFFMFVSGIGKKRDKEMMKFANYTLNTNDLKY